MDDTTIRTRAHAIAELKSLLTFSTFNEQTQSKLSTQITDLHLQGEQSFKRFAANFKNLPPKKHKEAVKGLCKQINQKCGGKGAPLEKMLTELLVAGCNDTKSIPAAPDPTRVKEVFQSAFGLPSNGHATWWIAHKLRNLVPTETPGLYEYKSTDDTSTDGESPSRGRGYLRHNHMAPIPSVSEPDSDIRFTGTGDSRTVTRSKKLLDLISLAALTGGGGLILGSILPKKYALGTGLMSLVVGAARDPEISKHISSIVAGFWSQHVSGSTPSDDSSGRAQFNADPVDRDYDSDSGYSVS